MSQSAMDRRGQMLDALTDLKILVGVFDTVFFIIRFCHSLERSWQ